MSTTAAASKKPHQTIHCSVVGPQQEHFIGNNSILISPQSDSNQQYYLVHFDHQQHEVDVLQKEPGVAKTESERKINFADVTASHRETVSFHDIGGVIMRFTGALMHSEKGNGAMIIPQECKVETKLA